MKFRVSKFDGLFFTRALPVIYSEERPVINLAERDKELLARGSVLTKALPWSYEKEWRIVDFAGAGIRKFPPSCLEEIIFGSKVENTEIELVKGWVKSSGYSVRFSKARLHDSKYAISIEPLIAD